MCKLRILGPNLARNFYQTSARIQLEKLFATLCEMFINSLKDVILVITLYRYDTVYLRQSCKRARSLGTNSKM